MDHKKWIFISVPMADRTDEEIEQAIYAEAKIYIQRSGLKPEDVVFVNNFDGYRDYHFYEHTKCKNLGYIGEALKKLAMCDVAVFGKGWKKARGCMLEATACTLYGIPVWDNDK